ncbi:MAG: lactonase family protein [Planctomycetaceae bacterium]|nr:lactonase family protein [Planctomycetaceae bacterium]
MRTLPMLSLAVCTFLHAATVFAGQQWVFIASPANPPSILVCSLDTETGALGETRIAAADVNTGFMALHPTLPLLYAGTSEAVEAGQPNGYVRAYRIDSRTGQLEFLNKAPTADSGTTHIEVSRDGRFVAVCHYGGEGTSLIPLDANGTLRQTVSRVKHEGSSAHPQRQKRPHPHGVAFATDGKFVCVADLGNDHVEVFPISSSGELQPGGFWKAAPGAGPRHVSFHPSGKWLYCINELDNTLSVLAFNSATGELSEIETVNTLPADFDGANTTAEVVVHPSGKFLYGSNRGHNSTAVYRIDAGSGRLTFVEHVPTQGDHPRFIGLDPTGKIFIAANMNGNNLVSFRIGQQSGALQATGHQAKVPRPMCLLFVPAS